LEEELPKKRRKILDAPCAETHSHLFVSRNLRNKYEVSGFYLITSYVLKNRINIKSIEESHSMASKLAIQVCAAMVTVVSAFQMPAAIAQGIKAKDAQTIVDYQTQYAFLKARVNEV